MPKTTLDTRGERFLVNSRLTYSDIPACDSSLHGLLMNARFIQGVFDDRAAPQRFARFGYDQWDPEANTDRLISALPKWHEVGLRAITVGFQGGGPCFTTDNHTIDNNPFGSDGQSLDQAYAARMDRLIRAADECGMIVIVSLLYQGQVLRFESEEAISAAVTTGSRFLVDGGYTNVIVEIANENDVGDFRERPVVSSEDGMVMLIRLARQESHGLPIGCSAGGGSAYRKIAEASDVVLIHGNGQTRQQLANLVSRVRGWTRERPIVCNEDSPCISRLEVAFADCFSWGYYNNMTKQEPPADWSILPGEDAYFARRLVDRLGIEMLDPPDRIGAGEAEWYLAGFEPHLASGGKRWVRLASLYPERIDHVDFYRSGKLLYTSWDEPFFLYSRSNWIHDGVSTPETQNPGAEWSALVHRTDGTEVEVTSKTTHTGGS